MRRFKPFLGIGLLFVIGCGETEPTAIDYGPLFDIGPTDPPAVTIYDINMVEIDALTVDALESFTLIGYVVGNVPLYYYWYQTVAGGEPVLIAEETLYLIDYFIDEPGDYVIKLHVIDGNALTGSDEVVVTVLPVEPPVLQVDIDIKPGSFPNSINLGSNGNVPVAIFSTADFDATTIDPATVMLADAEVRVVGKKGNLQAALEDVNGDGLLDLVVHIDTEGMSVEEGDAGEVLVELTGETYDGQAIRGTDWIQVVP